MTHEYTTNLETLQLRAWAIAESNGWHEVERTKGDILALIHSEVSEALEAHRHGDYDEYAEELADIVIRVLDHAETEDIDLAFEINRKNEINAGREYRHGGKKL